MYIKKYSNILFIILQAILLVLAIEVGGLFATIYIITMLIWGIYWSYKHWDTLLLISDVILGQATGQLFYRNKVLNNENIKSNRKKRKKN